MAIKKINIVAVNDYPPIRFETRIIAADSLQDSNGNFLENEVNEKKNKKL